VLAMAGGGTRSMRIKHSSFQLPLLSQNLSEGPNPASGQQIKNVALVHGAFADGSGWEAAAIIT
jgi:hypothetical protein